MGKRRLPSEFEAQSFVQLIFPHAQSDWMPYLEEASQTFAAITAAIAKYEQCLIICDNIKRVQSYFNDYANLSFIQYQSNDTWARDCSAITIFEEGEAAILDFTFNGWGGKFEATLDNDMTSSIASFYDKSVKTIDLVLEGGAIESNGDGILLTTSQCLLNPNRNPHLSKEEIEAKLNYHFGTQKILWLEHGYLSGDDTDSHIDTLARFVSKESIMYVQCTDSEDEHYQALHAMEKELYTLRDQSGKAFHLIPLPMCEAIYFDGERLPATYANFLLINHSVLVPTYNTPQDGKALEIFQQTFPKREIIAVDCSVLIRQHGSLHCVTMQFPKSVKLH